jgi:hypothetical protein
MTKYGCANIGHKALAQCHDQIKPRRACQRQDGNDNDEHSKISVNQARAGCIACLVTKTDIDHPANRQGQGQRRSRRNDQCQQRKRYTNLVTTHKRRERQQGCKLGLVRFIRQILGSGSL